MVSRIARRGFCTVTSQPWLFVGLGNPGDLYKATRQNVGFKMIDAFAKSQGIPMNTFHFNAVVGKGYIKKIGSINEIPFLLAKPQTYMNLSGECTGPLVDYYKIPLNRVVVFHDDMDLPCGDLRLQSKGGRGRHNGLKSVIRHFNGNTEFARLRIGVGRPPGRVDPKAFMLQSFTASAQGHIDYALGEGAYAIKEIVCQGLTEAARCLKAQHKINQMWLQEMRSDSQNRHKN
ncbi:peptidyl-tRNA hydrolase, mitochondrial [Heracleum sosnowskyi]|uniref:Peptidyl-tRNA hydrolase, mitochondrial n=1 Tax=Heracleum sosnowskyi TaxID=360622 RepID=A0AAD8J9A1_9APIA|nr:peptidyl-tRNA hydrolase, mitochondrial [Heracleum sosnowskyi]